MSKGQNYGLRYEHIQSNVRSHNTHKERMKTPQDRVGGPEDSTGSVSEASEHDLSCRTPSFITIGHKILDVEERDRTTSAIKSSSASSSTPEVVLPLPVAFPRDLLACTSRTSTARESQSVVSVRNEKVGPRAGFSFVTAKTDGDKWGGWTVAALFSTSTIKP